MKKIIGIFLILALAICALTSCNKVIEEDILPEATEEVTQNISNTDITNSEDKATNIAQAPADCYQRDEVITALSLEEYNSKINVNGKFHAIPNDSNSDFTEFGFEFERISYELFKDQEGIYRDYEDMEIVYHHEQCPYEFRSYCELAIDIRYLVNGIDMTRLEHVFLFEKDGLKIYHTIPDNPRREDTVYTILVNERCRLVVSIPEQLTSIVSETQAEQILNQAIDLAKIVKATLD